MTGPSDNARFVGRYLLKLESHGDFNNDMVADATDQVTRKLGQPLGRLLGASGYEALLRRAIHLADRDFAFLHSVPPPTADGAIIGLRVAVALVEKGQAHAALTEILIHLVWLLFTFIGEDLTRRTLQQIWPEAQFEQSGSDSEEAHT